MSNTLVFKNSFWAISSSIFQNIIFSVFFIIMARSYDTEMFSSYILANTLYGLILSFSTLGMAQWYIRALKESSDSKILSALFLKIQLYAGCFFFLLNVFLSFLLYQQTTIHVLSVLLGLNIVLDNLIHVFKTINIATYQQRQTFMILSAEATLKLILGIAIFYIVPDLFLVAFSLLFLRIISLFFFFLNEKNGFLKLSTVFHTQLEIKTIIKTLYANRFFLVIGSISVLFWSIGNILVSKFLDFNRVADYEISFKLFTMAEVIPVMVSASLFPLIVEKVKTGTLESSQLLKAVSYGNVVYGLVAYTFVFSFSEELIPILFGEKYSQTADYCKEMFLTILIFPSALFQANILIALKMEKTDMHLNLLSLGLNLTISIMGLYLTRSLSSINYAILISFVVFHVSQEYYLIQRGISTIKHAMSVYGIIIGGATLYLFLEKFISPFYLFPTIWCLLLLFIIPTLKKIRVQA